MISTVSSQAAGLSNDTNRSWCNPCDPGAAAATAFNDTAGQAIPSYLPSKAAEHFTKLECFCFKQQPFKSGETKEFPVVFVINPKLPQDVHTITLSYTFFEVAGATAMAAQ